MMDYNQNNIQNSRQAKNINRNTDQNALLTNNSVKTTTHAKMKKGSAKRKLEVSDMKPPEVEL